MMSDLAANIGATPPTTERRQYSLDSLAYHLSLSKQYKKLQSLFDNDYWMHMRVTTNNYTYLGFVNDLEIAWASLQEMDEESTAASEITFSHYVRLGLISSSITSRSNVPVNLLVSAASKRFWSIDQVLATISRYPTVAERVIAFTGLLMIDDLEPDERRIIQQQVYETIINSPDEFPVKQLIDLLPHLEQPMSENLMGRIADTISLISEIQTEMRQRLMPPRSHEDRGLYINEVLDLIPHLPPEKLPKIIKMVSDAILSKVKSLIQEKKFKDYTQPSNLGEFWVKYYAYTLLKDTEDLGLYALQLEHLAPYLKDHPAFDEILNQLIEILEIVDDADFYQRVVAAFTSYFRVDGMTRLKPRTFRSNEPQKTGSKDSLRNFFDRLGPDFLHKVVFLEKSHVTNAEDPLRPTRVRLSKQAQHHQERGEYTQITSGVYSIVSDWTRAALSYLDNTSQADAESSQSAAIERRSGDREQVYPENARAEQVSWFFKVGAPVFLMVMASYIRFSDEVLCALIDEYFDDEEMALQFFLLGKITAEAIGVEREAEFQRSARRIKGAMLRSALKYTHLHSGVFANVWSNLPDNLLDEADLSLLLDFVVELPAEPERNLLVDVMYGELARRSGVCPRLQALALFVSHLKGDLLLKALQGVLDISDPTARKNGLDLVAPYLERNEIARALDAISGIPDTLEQSWALSSLVPGLDGHQRNRVEGWALEAALQIASGGQLGSLLVRLMEGKDDKTSTEMLERTLRSLSHMDPNNRMDALESLILNWQGTIPTPAFEAALALPTISSGNRYSWRGHAISYLAEHFPEEMIPEVWTATLELPRRLNIGEGEPMGWHWTLTYPFAAAVYNLAPRLRGELLEQAFEEAKQFYWTAREEIFRRLAPNADTALAGKILDFTLTMAEKYATHRLSAQQLFEQEGAFVPGSPELFHAMREVGCAEIIAALAPKLSRTHLEKAAGKVASFSNVGPRSWLPARLAPYVPDTVLRRMLSIATVAALEFIVDDPTRFDLFIELVPHIKRLLEAEVRQIRDLVSPYFPEEDKLILSPEERNLLASEDRRAYEQLMEKYIPVQMKRLEFASEQEQREILEEAALSPFFGSQLDEISLQVLLRSPLAKRLEAFPNLVQQLSSQQVTSVVTHTLEELLQVEARDEDFTEKLCLVIPYLPKELYPRVLAVALGMSDTGTLTVDDLERETCDAVLREGENRLTSEFNPEPFSPTHARLGSKLLEDRFLESFQKIESNRSRLLKILIPFLDIHSLELVVEAVLQFHEIERVHSIWALMPHVKGKLKSRVYDDALTTTPPFGLIWILWTTLDDLDEIQRQRAIPIAISAAKSLESKMHVAVALLLLFGLTEDLPERSKMLRLALEAITSIEDESSALKLLAIFVQMANSSPDLMQDVLAFIFRFKDSDNQMKGLILFARDNPQWREQAAKYFRDIHFALVNHLHRLLYSERSTFLTGIANLSQIYQLFVANTSSYPIAITINEICEQWKWL
jgi:hypothetical protein